MRVSGAPPPRAANGAETEIVNHVVGEDELGDQPGRPIGEIRPISPAITRQHKSEYWM
jgi:hypothetical protein